MPSQPPPPASAAPRGYRPSRLFAALVLLALGAQWYVALDFADDAPADRRTLGRIAGAAALIVALFAVPALRRRAVRAVEFLRAPSPRARRITALALAVGAFAYFLTTALAAERQFRPALHDEYAYTIQARLAAQGRLWAPAHECAEHFDTFHVFATPVYAPKYSPGTAIMCAPALWVGLDPWVAPLAACAAAVGLLYLVLTHTIDGVAGLLGALMLPTSELVRRVSIEVLSQGPMLALLLTAVWALIHWRRARAPGWMAVCAAALGWAAITRPVDALSIGLPVGAVVLAALVRRDAAAAGPRRAGLNVAVGVACLVPFAAVQLAMNKAVTGHLTQLPWAAYAKQFDPYDALGPVPLDPPRTSASPIEQKRTFSAEFTTATYRQKQATPAARRLLRDRLVPTLNGSLPNLMLIALVPVGLLGLVGPLRPRGSDAGEANDGDTRPGHAGGRLGWVLPAALVPFLLLYNHYTFFIAHYAVPIAPAVICLVLAGAHALCAALPGRAVAGARALAALLIAAVTALSLPQLEHDWPDSSLRQGYAADDWGMMAAGYRYVDTAVDAAVRRHTGAAAGPALVFFRWHPDAMIHIEPVYNDGVAWPDDAPVLRAHDLGEPANRRLLDYYLRHGQDRHVFVYDRDPARTLEPIRYLGRASQIIGAAR
ncbi:MAG TPA: hypothetical protein VEA69_09445 [Tepidisphaeraceae bacterium]|nr:hypothetical protein [Tepidisphaeraceae bacterium]